MNPLLHRYDFGGSSSAVASAFSTTRHGGVSQGLFGTFNINPFCGDSAEAVSANRLALAGELGISDEAIILPRQVHGDRCLVVDEALMHLDPGQRTARLDGVDCVMSCLSGVCIGVSTADCIPVLLYDDEHHVAAAAHAGWRGTVQRIVEKAVRQMQAVYDTNPGLLRAVIGPGISLKNFEVGQEVYDAFQKQHFDMAAIAKHYEKWHIDLPLCNRLQLMGAGVPSTHIQDAAICTYDHAGDFFSARRLGAASGRIYTGILLT